MFFKKKNGLVCEQIDDEVIVFDTDKEQFYEFAGLGSLIWIIMDGKEVGDIAQKICEEYDVAKEVVISDITSFFDDLLSKNLIVRIEDV